MDDVHHLLINFDTGNARLRTFVDGDNNSHLHLGFNPNPFKPDTWYRWEIDWRDAEENAIGFDVREWDPATGETTSRLSRSIENTPYTTMFDTGGFMFGGHSRMHFDNFRILH